MQKILVTGGLGFIASNLIKKLLKKYYVINVDKVSYASNFYNTTNLYGVPGILDMPTAGSFDGTRHGLDTGELDQRVAGVLHPYQAAGSLRQ